MEDILLYNYYNKKRKNSTMKGKTIEIECRAQRKEGEQMKEK